MNKISIAFVAALSLAAFTGCKKKGGDCDKAMANAMEVSKADMKGMDDKMVSKMKDISMQHCKDDKWGDDVLKCMSDAKSSADLGACQGKMTPEQKDKMQKAMMEAMTPPGGGAAPAGGGEASGAAPAGSGEASGAAPAGSAAAPAGSGEAGSAAGSAAPAAGSGK